MLTSKWILQTMKRQLIIRMDLTRHHRDLIGWEAVRTHLISYDKKEGREVQEIMANISYNCFEAESTGLLKVEIESDRRKFSDLASGIIIHWDDTTYSWLPQEDKMFRLIDLSGHGRRAEIMPLSSSNVLVLQHLARVHGVLATEAQHSPVFKQAILRATCERLKAVIQQGNRQLAALTRMS